MKARSGEILPVKRPRLDAAASYDRLSGFYDRLTEQGERSFREAGLAVLAVAPGDAVLEIGCGTGASLPALAGGVGQTGLVCGLDLSAGMLRRAQDRAQTAVLCRGDAVRLPFGPARFDVAWMSFTLELFDTPDIPRVLAEVRRVLVSGGRLGVAALSREGEGSWMRRLYEWGHMRWPSVLDCRPIYASRSLEDAGFRVLRLEEMRYWGIRVDVVLAVA